MIKGLLPTNARRLHGNANPSSVLLCGYYGEGNLGDDLLLKILLEEIDNSFTLLITSNKNLTKCLLTNDYSIKSKSLKESSHDSRNSENYALKAAKSMNEQFTWSKLVRRTRDDLRAFRDRLFL